MGEEQPVTTSGVEVRKKRRGNSNLRPKGKGHQQGRGRKSVNQAEKPPQEKKGETGV